MKNEGMLSELHTGALTNSSNLCLISYSLDLDVNRIPICQDQRRIMDHLLQTNNGMCIILDPFHQEMALYFDFTANIQLQTTNKFKLPAKILPLSLFNWCWVGLPDTYAILIGKLAMRKSAYNSTCCFTLSLSFARSRSCSLSFVLSFALSHVW